MDTAASALIAILSVVLVLGGMLYVAYAGLVAVFGTGESGQAVLWFTVAFVGFSGFLGFIRASKA